MTDKFAGEALDLLSTPSHWLIRLGDRSHER